jgi:hypothetical protein
MFVELGRAFKDQCLLQSLEELIGVKIWSQMGWENMQIGLCTAGKNNLIKNIQRSASGLE